MFMANILVSRGSPVFTAHVLQPLLQTDRILQGELVEALPVVFVTGFILAVED